MNEVKLKLILCELATINSRNTFVVDIDAVLKKFTDILEQNGGNIRLKIAESILIINSQLLLDSINSQLKDLQKVLDELQTKTKELDTKREELDNKLSFLHNTVVSIKKVFKYMHEVFCNSLDFSFNLSTRLTLKTVFYKHYHSHRLYL